MRKGDAMEERNVLSARQASNYMGVRNLFFASGGAKEEARVTFARANWCATAKPIWMPGLKLASVNRKAVQQAPHHQRHRQVRPPRRSRVLAAFAPAGEADAALQRIYSHPPGFPRQLTAPRARPRALASAEAASSSATVSQIEAIHSAQTA